MSIELLIVDSNEVNERVSACPSDSFFGWRGFVSNVPFILSYDVLLDLLCYLRRLESLARRGRADAFQ